MTDKDKYRELCETEESIRVFQQAWFLDAAVGEDGWDVVIKEQSGAIGAFPFLVTKKYGLNISKNPIYSPFLGPWIKLPAKGKYSNKLSKETKLLEELIATLPGFSLFRQKLDKSLTNLVAFIWEGYTVQLRYTFVIESDDYEQAFADFGSQKSIIRKAGKELEVRDLSLDEFIRFYQNVPEDKLVQGFSLETFERICKAFLAHGTGRTMGAINPDGEILTAVFLVWDHDTVYYLFSVNNPKVNNQGGNALLLSEAIRYTIEIGKAFDFEGSIIPPIHKFFRSFGGKLRPFYQVEKVDSAAMKAGFFGKDLLGKKGIFG